jgi:hypothetical protein
MKMTNDIMPKPCNECPWRINSAQGWLGPNTAEEWVKLAHGEELIACHLHIKDSVWDGIQCKGAADYRENVAKLPRNPEIVLGENNENVFKSPMKFIEHHKESKEMKN